MMTRDQARKTLLLYRPGTADAAEPEIAEALALAQQDAELSRWLAQQVAQQEIVRAKIRQMPVPAGLKEQIISERRVFAQKRVMHLAITWVAALAGVMAIGWWAAVVLQRPPDDDTFSNYRNRMVSAALRDYSMDLETNNAAKIRDYLAQQRVAVNYELPAGLQKAAEAGCAIKSWQGAKVALLCFRTGQPLSPGGKSDMWLFVVDRTAVKGAPAATEPQFAKINKLMTATWTRGGKLYLLGAAVDEQALRAWF
jgi:hypothetical protein